MQARLFLVLIGLNAGLLLTMPASDAHDGDSDHHDHAHPVKPARLYRPTAVPDRICLSLTTDPATSMAVNWRTDTSVKSAYVEYGLATDGPGFQDSVDRVTAVTQDLESDLSNAHYHSAELVHLQPGTQYLYRVGDGVNWSEWSEFQTASDDDAAFSFVYFGDAQNDIKSHWSRVVRHAFRDAPQASFFLHAGDLVNRAESDGEWGEWFYASGFIHRSIPAIAIPGNHEMAKRDGERVLSHHWRPTFALPHNGPEGLEESCYYIDYHGVRFVCLNSNERQAEQAAWLQQVLSEADGWKIVSHHHPIYSASVGRDNAELRALWQPIYDKHGVDLVLQGHDHTYARSTLIRAGENPGDRNASPRIVGDRNVSEGAAVQDASGTVYVVSVSGPKMYKVDKRPFLKSTAQQKQLYQVITIDGNQLDYRACTATGELYDQFRLTRRPGEANVLTESAIGEPLEPAIK